jgi:O-antigen/teichoic acid export membrane protein
MLAGAVAGTGANLVLVPLYGGSGAALAKVLAHAVILIYAYRFTSKEIATVPLVNELSRSALSALPMVALVWLVPGGWWVKLGLGLVTYLGLVATLERKTWHQITCTAQ